MGWGRSDVLTQFRLLPDGLSCSFYFDDDGAEPLYSYIKLDDDGRIVSVREKQAISTLANTGAYGFSRSARPVATPYPTFHALECAESRPPLARIADGFQN